MTPPINLLYGRIAAARRPGFPLQFLIALRFIPVFPLQSLARFEGRFASHNPVAAVR